MAYLSIIYVNLIDFELQRSKVKVEGLRSLKLKDSVQDKLFEIFMLQWTLNFSICSHSRTPRNLMMAPAKKPQMLTRRRRKRRPDEIMRAMMIAMTSGWARKRTRKVVLGMDLQSRLLLSSCVQRRWFTNGRRRLSAGCQRAFSRWFYTMDPSENGAWKRSWQQT